MLLLNRRRYMHTANDVIMTTATNPEVLAICYAQGWCASADKMTKSEAEQVTSLGTAFRQSNIVHFDELQYFGITQIPNYAFMDCTSLASIVVPNGVTYIGGRSFQNCTSLTNPILPNSVTTIDLYAFMYCSALALTALPSSLTTIETSAFMDCTSLALTELPSGITSLPYYAFQNCTNLALSELPSGVTEIKNAAFRGCTNLPLAELPSNLESIELNAFRECSNVTFSSIPASVTSVGQAVFYVCPKVTIGEWVAGISTIPLRAFGFTAMQSFHITSDVTYIDNEAFAGNYKLATIRCDATTAPSLGTNVFQNCGTQVSGTKQLIVPSGASGYDSGDWLTLQTTYGYTLIYE